jgi:hypothetical protein
MPVQPEYNRSIKAFFFQGSGASERSAYYRASSDYYATAPTTWDLTYPDVSGVAGFNTAWAFQPGASTRSGIKRSARSAAREFSF